MRLPKLIYELLPALYVVFGLSSWLYFYFIQYSKIGMFSGLIFIITAYLISQLRYNYRRYHIDW